MLLVSGCDKLHNALAIVRDLEDPSVGAKVFERFTGGRTGTLGYYQSLCDVLQLRNICVANAFFAAVQRMHELVGAPRAPLPAE